MRRSRSLLALAGLAMMLSACGIPLDATAKPVSSAQAGLLPGAVQIPGSTPKPGSTPFSVYFIRDAALYPVQRYLYSSTLSVSAELTAALAALDAGPTSPEAGQSITTSLSEIPRANLRLDSITDNGHVARVALDQEFIPPTLFGTTLALAYAQIVYTLTSSVFGSEIVAVEFVLDGSQWPAYLPNGQLSNTPVDQHEYSVFSQPGKPVSTPRHVTTRLIR